ncbi:class I SAM-dependent methyltransferase [Roseivirga sp.]|uniref:class I SAM-dependent methyltransferase n=1 Tax=Roseivirga sp. TaxID=1964215 RepID=UPI003B8B7A97
MTTESLIKSTSDLEKYFNNNSKRLIHKWKHYFDIYDRHFNKYRDKELVILEIGVFHGGSLQMWKDYFGDKVKIYGIDINPRCKSLEEDGIEILIGSQSDRDFLRSIKKSVPRPDILIDDGGHTMKQQITTYEELFDFVKDDGVYLCEDVHTSYQVALGGGFKRKGTFVEYSKNFIDWLNAYHSEQRGLKVSSFTKSVNSIHYYDSIVIVEKAVRQKPIDLKSGEASFDNDGFDENTYQVFKRKVRTIINLVLRFFRLPSF